MKVRTLYTSVCTIVVTAVALTLWPVDPAVSDKKRYRSNAKPHEDVYKYRRSGKILPFKDILKFARPHIKGEVIKTEFEYEDGIPAYEFKYIDRRGRVMELYIDARNGKVLKNEVDD